MRDMIKRNWIKYTLRVALLLFGAAGGYAYYRFVGCASGTCAITSNPNLSTIYGVLLGALIGSTILPGKRTQDKEEDPNG